MGVIDSMAIFRVERTRDYTVMCNCHLRDQNLSLKAKSSIPDHHEPLIGKELFEQVQASARRYSLPSRKNHTYPLRGKVVCGCCGHALTRMERKTSYYLCRHSEADERFSCHGLKVLVDDLEQAVFDTLKCQVGGPGK